MAKKATCDNCQIGDADEPVTLCPLHALSHEMFSALQAGLSLAQAATYKVHGENRPSEVASILKEMSDVIAKAVKAQSPRTVNTKGITSCCQAMTSIGIDDGVEFCKRCYKAVSR